jgi:acylpyruvate hydrolase
MRIARFNAVTEPVSRARTGAVVADCIGDLRAAYARYLLDEERDAQGREVAALRIPADVRHILQVGKAAAQAMEQALAYLKTLQAAGPDARGADGEALLVPAAQARLHNPLKPARIVVVRGSLAGARDERPSLTEWPPASVMGPVRDLPKPASVEALSYATGLAVVIGRACRAVATAEASSCIAGYMVANAVEEAHSVQGAAPPFRRCVIGPYLVTPEELHDIAALRIVTRVNGTECQAGSTRALKAPVGELISKLSVHGLEAGDVIVTALLSDAAPAGSGAAPWLEPGDILESEIEGLGVMRNKVVAEN